MADTDPTTSTAGSTPTAVCTVRAVRAARPWGGALSDLVLDGGTVAAASPHDPSTLAGPDDVDGAGRLALPAFTDAHVHLDSTRVGRPSKPHTAEPHTAEPGPL